MLSTYTSYTGYDRLHIYYTILHCTTGGSVAGQGPDGRTRHSGAPGAASVQAPHGLAYIAEGHRAD